MISSVSLLCTAIATYLVYKIVSGILERWAYQRRRDGLGCREARKYPHKDPFLGLDLLFQGEKQRANSTHLQAHLQVFRDLGKTHEVVFAGNRMIRTMEARNVQAVLGYPSFYGLEPLRTGLAEPLFGKGVNTTDGDYWHWCRDMLKPTFSRVDVCDLRITEAHFQDLYGLLPADGSIVDMQPLFSKLYLDLTTGLLFGDAARTLSKVPNPAGEKFVEDFDYALKGLGTRVRLGPLKFLHQDRAWYKAIRDVHAYTQPYIDNALKLESQRKQGIENEKAPKVNGNGHQGIERKQILLNDIVKECQDPVEVRSQVMAVFMPSRETVSFLASNVVWALSRHPDVQKKLRAEVLGLGHGPLTFEAIRSIDYLQWVINEAHRMWPVSSGIPRSVLADVALPTGGGPNGSSPILLRKGDYVMCEQYCLHHNADFWGLDHDQYRPERWRGLKPLWNFGPFGGGPRTCPAQHLVNTEVAYVVVRLLQEFEKIEAGDGLPWTEMWLIDMCNKHGCRVKLTPVRKNVDGGLGSEGRTA